MNKTTKLLATSIALASLPATAANYAIEARGDAMGGVGVVSANFLTAPFYNPALVAIYRRNDDFGMITPSFGGNYNDPDDMKSNIDAVLDATTSAELTNALNKLDGNQANFDLGGVVAFAIPNQFVAANAFAKAYTESFATPNVYNDATATEQQKLELTAVEAVSIGVTEIGLSLAKYQTFMGQHLSFGVTPKIQRIYTYNYVATINDYDLSDVRENGAGETAFNIDAGALWFFGPFRVGFSATNLISRDIVTKDTTRTLTSGGRSNNVGGQYSYKLEPVYTVGAGIVADYFTLSVDYDINEAKKFTSFDDNEQMIRVGTEVDILRQLKLRGGYYKNLAYSGSEGTITAGIGLSPLNLFQLDISANYTNENAMGASINFLASY